MLMNMQNVLVLAPHTDDGELGAGGTIAKLCEQGADVHYCTFSIAEDSVPDHLPKDILLHEVKEATSRLGVKHPLIIHRFPVRKLQDYRQDILELMLGLKRKHAYDLVLIPSVNDIHQDHQLIAKEATRAFKNTTILSYELPWNNLIFQNTCFFSLNEGHIVKKINALQAYQSQVNRDYMSEDFIKGMARMRGVQVGVKFAEVFEVVRWVIK